MLSLIVAGVVAGAQISTSPKIIHASVFKNGYAFITREIPVSKSGEVQIEPIPESTFGTLWFGVTRGMQVKQITNGAVTHSYSVGARSLDDLLRLNVGHEVDLTVKDFPNARGVLKSADGDIVILGQGGGDQVVFKDRILGLVSTTPLERESHSATTSRSLRVRVETTAPGKLYFVSLEKGITWDSAYLVEIHDKKLTLTSRATIVDDLADIDGIEVLLSAMAPSFSTSGQESLLTGDARQTAILVGGQGLVGDSIDFISYDPTDNSLVVQGNDAKSRSWAQATGLAGFKREDQFFYRQPDVRLKRGERGQFVLYQKETPYSDLFTLDVAGVMTSNGLMLSQNHQQVSHLIKFTNQTGQPLTAAPVSFLAEGQLLGQSITNYTPIGGNVDFSLGSAPEIEADAADEELNRTRDVRKKGKQSYDLVTMKGTLSLKNLGAKKVKVRVSKLIIGESMNSSNAPEVQKTAAFSGMNPSTRLTWELEMDPGKKLNLSFEYRTYVTE